MSKFADRKWKLASGVGFTFALDCDLIAKYIAGVRMSSLAKPTAGLPMAEPGWLASHFPDDFLVPLGLLFAVVATICWSVSGWRSEPGSSFAIVLLAVLYTGLFFVLV